MYGFGYRVWDMTVVVCVSRTSSINLFLITSVKDDIKLLPRSGELVNESLIILEHTSSKYLTKKKKKKI